MKGARRRSSDGAVTRPAPSHPAPAADRLGTWTAIAIFFVALSLRLIHLWQIRGTPFVAILMGDARSYDDWAQTIAGGDLIGQQVFYQAPLYPYFLGTLYRILGHHVMLVRVSQMIVGSAACVLIGTAGARLFSRATGIVAGIALAVYAPAIFFDGLIQKSVLDSFFVCLMLWLISGVVVSEERLLGDAPATSNTPRTPAGGVDRATRRRWLGLGMAMGGLSLTRENALVLVAVVLMWRLARFRVPLRHRLITATIFVAGLAAVLTPVVVRNMVVGHGVYLTTSQFGPNFYVGNNPRSDGTYMSLRPGRGAPEFERQDATELAERARGRSLTPAEVSRYWTDGALAFITEQPGAWLRLLGRKFMLLWNANEALDTESQETLAEFSLILRLGAIVGHFGLLVPLAVFGVCATWNLRDRLWLFYALTLAYAASVLVFYVFARYRFPLVPMLILFASPGIVRLPRFAGSASTSDKLTAIVLTASAALLANRPLLDSRYMQAVTYTNLGTAFRAQDRLDDAVSSYRRALTMFPNYPEAHYNLANALLDQQKIDEAADHFQIALTALPGSAGAYNTVGISMLDKRRIEEAVSYFEQALSVDPTWVEAHQNLASALAEQGRFDLAVQHLRRAIELNPKNSDSRYDLGAVLLQQQDFAGAERELVSALEIAPGSAELHNLLGVALASQGRTREAVPQFEQALALKPDFSEARRNLDLAR